MDSSTKCPVCGREGINDYHQGEVRCPGCGSNLEVFRLLDSVEADLKAKSSKWKPIALAAAILALIFAILYFNKGVSPDAQEVAILKDSIAALNEKVNDLQKNGATVPAEAQPVEVKKGEKGAEKPDAEPAKAEEKKDDVTAPAGKVTERNGKKYYKVQKGDNLWKICRKLYGDGKVKPEEIARLNGLRGTDQLEVDQELVVK